MTSKNVWIINHYAEPPTNSGGTRHYSLAKHLKDQGWQAHIIAASTSLNTNRQLIEDGENVVHSIIDGISFLRLRAPTYKSNGLSRLWNMLAFSIRLLFPSSTKTLPAPDVIIGSTVHPFAAFAAYLLAKRHKVPFIYEVRDLWPQTLIDMGALTEKSLATIVFRKIEIFLAKKSAYIVTLLPQSYKYFERYGIAKEKIIWIPNGIEVEDFPYINPPSGKKVFDLYYFGAHGKANSLTNLISAMEILSKGKDSKDIQLTLIGDGPEKAALKERVSSLGLKNVRFLDPVSKSEIGRTCANADAFVFNLAYIPVFQYGISSNKLFDYMACGRPILFCCEASNNIVQESNSGVSVYPEQPLELAEAIVAMANRPLESRIEMGKNGRKYVQTNHDFSKLTKRLSSTLEDAIRVS